MMRRHEVLLLAAAFFFAGLGMASDKKLSAACDELTYTGALADLTWDAARDRFLHPESDPTVLAFRENPSSIYSSFLGKTPWEVSKLPSADYRLIGLYMALPHIFAPFGMPVPGDSIDEALRQAQVLFSKEDPPSPSIGSDGPLTPEETKKILTTYLDAHASEETQASTDQPYFLICLTLSTAQPFACAKNLRRLARLFNTGGISMSIGDPYLVDILTSDRPARGARLAARRILAKVIARDTDGDLFGDIHQAYLDSGYSEKEATQWTWDLILLSFIHGQNGYLLSDLHRQPYNGWTIASALTISATAVILDPLKKTATGRLYTLPPSVTTSCDNGKPYHFWVPAYAARESVRKDFSPKTSRWSTYLLEVGYQMKSHSKDRDPLLASMSAPEAPINQKNRLDLSYAAVGALYGSLDGSSEKRSFSIDSSFAASWKASVYTASEKWAQRKKYPFQRESFPQYLAEVTSPFFWLDAMAPTENLSAIE